MRRYGTVRWFGGIDNSTGKENKFGFITDISEKDVYLNIRDWKGNEKPNEGQLLTYEYQQEHNGKTKAVNAVAFDPKAPASPEGFSTLITLFEELNVDVTEKYGLINTLVVHAKTYFDVASIDEIYEQILVFGNSGKIFTILDRWDSWQDALSQIYEKHGEDVFKRIPIKQLSCGFIETHQKQFAMFLASLDKEALLNNISSSSHKLPNSVIFYLVARGNIKDKSELGGYWGDFEKYVTSMVEKNEADYPEYVSSLIEELKPVGGLRNNPLVRPIIHKALYKRYLYEKSERAIELFRDSDILCTIPECMVLNALFEPLITENDLDVVYKVFFHKLWSLIVSGQLVPGFGLDRLFPNCSAMPNGLACEAVYWADRDIYLCRGKRCYSPSVVPDLTQNFSNFSVYDWFAHFGISYSRDKHPLREDFPIKVAGYFNRLVEIFPHIHCRVCKELMVPNFKYARVRRIYYENGQRMIGNLSAAYRCTVFHCKTENCTENGKGYYINHCIGYNCSKIIDSRDCVTKCVSGRFICNECGSCCSECAKTHPNGLCPKCASSLIIYENVSDTPKQYNNRFVQCCSPDCDFYIPSEKLSKKFYLKTCSAPIRVKTPGPV